MRSATEPLDERMERADEQKPRFPLGPVQRALARSVPLRLLAALLGVLLLTLLVAGVINLGYTRNAIAELERADLRSRTQSLRATYALRRARLLAQTRAVADGIVAVLGDHVPSRRELIAQLSEGSRAFDLDLAMICDAAGRRVVEIGESLAPLEIHSGLPSRREGAIMIARTARGAFAQLAMIPYPGVDGRRVVIGGYLLDDQLAYSLREIVQGETLVVVDGVVVGATLELREAAAAAFVRDGEPVSVSIGGDPKLISYVRIASADPGPPAWVGVVLPEVAATLAATLAQGRLVIFAVVVVVAVAGMVVILRLVTRPLKRLTATADLALGQAAVPQGELGDRDEVERLSEAIEELGLWVRLMRGTEEVKTRFVADAAHELRNPIATISGLTDTLALHHGDMPPEVLAESLVAIARQSQGLVELANKLLDYTALDAGLLELEVSPFLLAGLAREEAVSAGGPSSVVSVRVEQDLRVSADRTAVARILRNLLENARRYGGPTIWIEGRTDAGRAVIAVCDDGPGVEDDHVIAIFDPFVRATSSDKDHAVGLGLAIVLALVRAHGGEVWYEHGHPGARFLFTLPLAGA